MIKKFDEIDINLSGEITDLFRDLEDDNIISSIKCINLSKLISI